MSNRWRTEVAVFLQTRSSNWGKKSGITWRESKQGGMEFLLMLLKVGFIKPGLALQYYLEKAEDATLL